MSQRIEAVVEALEELLDRHGRDVVTDPAQMPALLAHQLGNTPRDNPLLRAVVAASHTGALREFSPTADHDESLETLKTAIITLGLPASDAADGAQAWAEALRNAAPSGSHITGSHITSSHITGSHITSTDITDPEAEIDYIVTEPDFFENEPVIPAPPTSPPVSSDATAVTMLVPPAPPPSSDRVVVDERGAAPTMAPGSAPRDPDAREPNGWPAKAKALCAVLAIGAILLGVLAFVGWNRDPSKEEAQSAQRQVATLQSDVDTANVEIKTAQDEATMAQATIAERDASLAQANAQIEASSTMTKAQYDNARWPETFTMNGSVAEGSCSLSTAACEKSAVVRNIVINCGGAPCGCVDGGCTVTSELWQTPAPVTYDAASGLFTATGLLDGDQFTCGGVAQATTFSFRFRASKIAYVDGWVGSEFAAELAETSEATEACLAGGRTYALSGPTPS